MTLGEVDSVISNYKEWVREKDLEEDRIYHEVVAQNGGRPAPSNNNDSLSLAPSHSLNLELSNSQPKSGNGVWNDQDYQRFYAAVELFKD